MKRTFVLGFLLFIMTVRADDSIVEAKEVPSGSLWSEQSEPLYADFKARKMGDLLTIVVLENTVAAAKAETQTSKSESASTTAGIGPLLKFFLPELGASGQAASSGSGSTTRSGSLSTRLSVIVVETRPNGVLKIEGTRTVQINGETQKLVLTGLVRIKDISADNTVLSTQMANAEIKFEGKGPIGSRQREGLITKLFKLLF
jgi:flagellar L-ring protein precursor FlgH